MRAFVFAAVAALAAGQTPTSQCHMCDSGPNCCAAGTAPYLMSGTPVCFDPAQGTFCDLCGECAKNVAPLDNIEISSEVVGTAGNGGGFQLTMIEDGMEGFLDIRGSTFQKFPDFMKGIGGVLFDRDVGPSWAPTFRCFSPPCDHYIFAYRGCRSCVSANIDILHELLSESGWVKNSCGPVFSHSLEGHQHKFTVYHLETAEELVTVAPGVALDFVWVASEWKAKLCSEEYSECSCNKRAECSYDRNTGTCRTFWCKKTNEDVCAKNKDGTLNVDDTPREYCEVPTPTPKTPAPTTAAPYATKPPPLY